MNKTLGEVVFNPTAQPKASQHSAQKIVPAGRKTSPQTDETNQNGGGFIPTLLPRQLAGSFHTVVGSGEDGGGRHTFFIALSDCVQAAEYTAKAAGA